MPDEPAADAAQSEQPPSSFSLPGLAYRQTMSVLAAFSFAVFIGHLFNLEWNGLIADFVSIWGSTIRPATKWVLDYTVVAFLAWAFHWHIVIPLLVRDYLSVGAIVLMSMIRSKASPYSWRNHVFSIFYRGIAEKNGTGFGDYYFWNFAKPFSDRLGSMLPRFLQYVILIPLAFVSIVVEFAIWITLLFITVCCWPMYLIILIRRIFRLHKHIAYFKKNVKDDIKSRNNFTKKDGTVDEKYKDVMDIVMDSLVKNNSRLRKYRREQFSYVLALSPLIYFSLLLVVNFLLLRRGG